MAKRVKLSPVVVTDFEAWRQELLADAKLSEPMAVACAKAIVGTFENAGGQPLAGYPKIRLYLYSHTQSLVRHRGPGGPTVKYWSGMMKRLNLRSVLVTVSPLRTNILVQIKTPEHSPPKCTSLKREMMSALCVSVSLHPDASPLPLSGTLADALQQDFAALFGGYHNKRAFPELSIPASIPPDRLDALFSDCVKQLNKVTITAGDHTLKLDFAEPDNCWQFMAIPTTLLGAHAKFTAPQEIDLVDHNSEKLISVTGAGDRTLTLDNLFYFISDECRAGLRLRLKDGGRTLGAVGMQWVQALANAVGCTEIRVSDDWTGPNNTRSDNLKLAATRLLRGETSAGDKQAEALRRRFERTHRADSYYARVAAGGFYGQFGAIEKTIGKRDVPYGVIDVASMVTLNAAFADLAL